MFFRNRIQRDIDQFKTLQKLDSRRLQRDAGHDDASAATDVGSPPRDSGSESSAENILKSTLGKLAESKQSVVGANATWEGKLTTDGSTWLEGKVSGEVEAGETVFVAKGAKVRANICARRAVIGGDVEGQITCREQLVVEYTGRLGGKVITRSLVVEDGAIVHSQIQMVREDENRRRAVGETTRGDTVALGVRQGQGLKAG